MADSETRSTRQWKTCQNSVVLQVLPCNKLHVTSLNSVSALSFPQQFIETQHIAASVTLVGWSPDWLAVSVQTLCSQEQCVMSAYEMITFIVPSLNPQFPYIEFI